MGLGNVEFALNKAESYIVRMRPSPATRCLKLSLQAFRRTLDSWSTVVPTDDQVRLLGERVAELLELAESSAPTVRFNAATDVKVGEGQAGERP